MKNVLQPVLQWTEIWMLFCFNEDCLFDLLTTLNIVNKHYYNYPFFTFNALDI